MSLKASKTTLTLMLCLGFVTASGCKSVDFGKPKLPVLPKLPSLAFWKSGDDSELPPPPARHFDPSRFGGGGGAKTQVADAGSGTRSTAAKFDKYGIRVKDSASGASELASKGLASAKASVDKLGAKPIRQPYHLDDLGDDEVLAQAENNFNLDTANLKNRLDKTKSSAVNQLSTAQQSFRSAMSSVSGVDAASSKSNSFAGVDNSFVATPVAKVADTVKSLGGIGGGGFLPPSKAFSSVKQVSADVAAAGKDSLYDAQGRLRSVASKIGNRTEGLGDGNRLKTEFEQRLMVAQKQAKDKSEAFKSGTSKAVNNQLSALAGVSNRTKDLVSKPFPKIGADGSSLRQSAGPVKTPKLQPNNNGLLPINKPNALATNSFGGRKSDAVSQMRLEVEEAKRQIALLKAEVAATKQSASAVRPPVQRVAQNTSGGVVLPLGRANDAFDPRAGGPVANQYQGQLRSPSALQPPAPRTPNYKSNPAGESNSFYPATPYGGFGGIQNKKGAVGQVGFNSASEFQNRVSQANAESAVDADSPGVHRADRIDSSVSEVLIPSSILSGSSSFTPGSTTPLRY